METFDRNHAYNSYSLANEIDPWLGRFVVTIRQKADPDAVWNQLLINSTHINHLVTVNKSWRLVPEKVNEHIKNGRIIVNMSADPFRGWEEKIVTELTEYTDKIVVLSSDIKYLLEPKPYICYVPFWYLNQRYTYDPISIIDQPRQYKLSSLNHVARYHRIENFIKLKRKSYFDQLLFSMLYQYNPQLIKRQVPSKFYNNDIIKEFENLIPEYIPMVTDDIFKIDLPAYSDSYVNLVTETSIYDNTIFISEKTWKPIMSGQFGLWLTNPGAVAFLRTCGFDMFDDIFNNHEYDKEPNLNRRIDMIHDIIDQIMAQDIDSIFLDTLSRRQANIDRFYSKDLEQILTAQCENFKL